MNSSCVMRRHALSCGAAMLCPVHVTMNSNGDANMLYLSGGTGGHEQ